MDLIKWFTHMKFFKENLIFFVIIGILIILDIVLEKDKNVRINELIGSIKNNSNKSSIILENPNVGITKRYFRWYNSVSQYHIMGKSQGKEYIFEIDNHDMDSKSLPELIESIKYNHHSTLTIEFFQFRNEKCVTKLYINNPALAVSFDVSEQSIKKDPYSVCKGPLKINE